MKYATSDSVDHALRTLDLRVSKLENRKGSFVIPNGEAFAFLIEAIDGDDYFRIDTRNIRHRITIGNSLDDVDIDLNLGDGQLLINEANGNDGQVFTSNGPNAAPDWEDVTGTDSNTFTLNRDAVNTADEDASYIAIASDEGGANDDLIRSTFRTDGDDEMVVFKLERNRNSAGYSEISSLFTIGTPGVSSAGITAGIRFCSGSATGARTTTLSLIADTLRSYLQTNSAVGFSAPSSGTNSEFFGFGAVATGTGAVAIGYNSLAQGSSSTAIGSSVNIDVDQATALGATVTARGENCVSIGYLANVANTNARAVVIGALASVTGSAGAGAESIAIGYDCDVTSATFAIGIGSGLDVVTSRTIVMGGNTTGAWAFIIGSGETSSAPGAVTINPSAASGTNIAGSNLSLRAGQSTGSGAGGDIILQTSPAGGAGSSLNSFVNRIQITGAGSIGFFNVTPVGQQTSGADLTNNVASGGTDDTIANYTDLTTYANDSNAIRNNIYQLARKLKQINDGLRDFGFFT